MYFKYISQISAITVLTITMTACGGSGSNSKNNVNTPMLENKAEADRLAAEAAKAEADRLAAEAAKAEADRLAAEAAKAEADRLAAEAAKAEADRLAAEAAKAEADRLTAEAAKAEADRLTAEAAKAEADRLAAETKALLQAFETKQLALENILGKKEDSFTGFGTAYINEDSINSTGQYNLKKATLFIYQQPYSIVIGTWLRNNIKNDIDQLQGNSTFNIDIAGLRTESTALPKEGQATYKGLAYRLSNISDLTYNVDFEKRIGSGYITGIAQYGGKIDLNAGDITKIDQNGKEVLGISSLAKSLDGSTGKYKIGFYGTQAQEIAGTLEMDQSKFLGDYPNINGKTEIGLGATRGEVSK